MDLVSQLNDIILKRIHSDKLVVPAMPEAATQALKILRDPTGSLRAVSTVLERDPLLALSVVKAANGANAGLPVSSLEQAVTRVGHNRLHAVVLEASAHQLFQSRDLRIQKACKDIWYHSVAVAVLTRDLATVLGGAEGDDAYLAGLLHDVGKPVVAGLLLETERVMSSQARGGWLKSEAWIDAIQACHRKVGVALAERWRLPDPIAQAIRDCGDYDAANRSSLANYVRFANAVAKIEGIYSSAVDLEEAKALIMIGRSVLGIEDEVVVRLSAGIADRARTALG